MLFYYGIGKIPLNAKFLKNKTIYSILIRKYQFNLFNELLITNYVKMADTHIVIKY